MHYYIVITRLLKCETLIEFARAECGKSAADFLQRCFNGTQAS